MLRCVELLRSNLPRPVLKRSCRQVRSNREEVAVYHRNAVGRYLLVVIGRMGFWCIGVISQKTAFSARQTVNYGELLRFHLQFSARFLPTFMQYVGYAIRSIVVPGQSSNCRLVKLPTCCHHYLLHTASARTSAIMGCGMSSEEKEGKERNEKIDNQLKNDRLLQRSEIKMLLLGTIYPHTHKDSAAN